MQSLKTFIAQVGVNALARQLGLSKQVVSHWNNGRQRPSPQVARTLEVMSEGAVRAAELCPEVYEGVSFWPPVERQEEAA